MPFYDSLTNQLPSIGYHLLLFAVILVVGWAAGRGAGYLFYRLSRAAGIEPVFRRTSIGRALLKSGSTAAAFVDQVARWAIYATAILGALLSLGIPSVSSAVEEFLAYLPSLLAALAILIVGLVLSDWLAEFIRRTLSPEEERVFHLGLAADLLKLVFYFITVVLALREAGVDTTILYIFAQALAWALAIGIGVGAGIVVGWALKDRVRAALS